MNAFIEAVIDLLKNPEKQESLRWEALALKDSFGWDKVAQQWHTGIYIREKRYLKFTFEEVK